MDPEIGEDIMRLLTILLLLFSSNYSFAISEILPVPPNTIAEITDYNEPVVFLVELKGPSIIEQKIKNDFSILSLSNIKIEHQSSRNALLAIDNVKITHEFKFAFNGFAVKAPRALLDRISKISSVSRVVLSEKVSIPPVPLIPESSGEVGILLDQSVGIIGAKALHEQNIRGEGKVIAIIDTGIDASHPAFAKPGKILKTLNTLTDSPDVKDGHGHGTHVAGIAAGDGGEIIGVAPDSKLVIVKALSDSGNGTMEDIIEGIEFIADLDQDPSTHDPVDVVNMSLGTTTAGDPNDPMARAVNLVSNYGVIFSIAAGNSGLVGIGSPGVAEKAITVGASTKTDEIAEFSSVGPVEKTSNLKPEIVAPGVNIKSSFPNNQYKRWNGTSMAAPHVAGAVALLEQLHPDWKLERIKNALMSSAKVITNVSSFSQGYGRIQLIDAARGEFSIAPSFLYLGTFFDLAGETKLTKEIELTNNSQNILNIKLRDKQTIKGIVFGLPGDLIVQPLETIKIPVEITIDQSSLSFPVGDRMYYEPNIELSINEKIMNFPVYLQRGIPISILKSNGNVVIFKKGSSFSKYFYANNEPKINMTVNPGEYVFTFDGYPSRPSEYYFIRKELDINATSEKEINLRPEEAKYNILVDSKDPFGEDCSKIHTTVGFFQRWTTDHGDSSYSQTIGLQPKTNKIFLSKSDFQFSLSSRCISGTNFSIISRAPGLVDKNETVETPTNMIPVKINVAPFLKDAKFWISDMQCHFFGCLGSLIYPATLTNYDNMWFDGNEVNLRWYIVKDRKMYNDTLSFYVDKLGIGHFGFLSAFYRHVPYKQFNFGYPSITWQGVFENRGDAITFRNTDYFLNPNLFIDSSGLILSELQPNPNYELKKEDGSIEKGKVNYAIDTDNSLRYLIATSPGHQELTIFAPPIDGAYGPVEFFVKATVDTSKQDPNPPTLRNVEVIYDGTPSYELKKNNVSLIEFESMDYEARQYPPTIRLSVKPTASTSWTSLQVSRKLDGKYTAAWEPINDGLHDIRISSTDESGNITEINQVGGVYVN